MTDIINLDDIRKARAKINSVKEPYDIKSNLDLMNTQLATVKNQVGTLLDAMTLLNDEMIDISNQATDASIKVRKEYEDTMAKIAEIEAAHPEVFGK